ncbi:MAG: hypothetical protein ACRC7G_00885 [Beijerinckiaceae bacterium]
MNDVVKEMHHAIVISRDMQELTLGMRAILLGRMAYRFWISLPTSGEAVRRMAD